MRLKIILSKLGKIPGALLKHARTPGQFLLLLNMLFWTILVRTFKPLLSVRRLFNLAAPKRIQHRSYSDDVLRYLTWFDFLHLFGKDKGCLIRTLVLYRYLSYSGVEPKVLIGFDGKSGHAWVELNGEALLETQNSIQRFTPTLFVGAGSAKLTPLAAHSPQTMLPFGD